LSFLVTEQGHQFRVETNIVHRSEPAPERIPDTEKMAEITPGMICAQRAIAGQIDRGAIFRKPFVIDIDRLIKIPRCQW
jgi:hypothetical protein